jgi:hypothetical protein
MLNTTDEVRWLLDAGPAHVVYEHDSGFTRTLCGQILRGGKMRTCSVRSVQLGRKCRECVQRVRLRNKYVGGSDE